MIRLLISIFIVLSIWACGSKSKNTAHIDGVEFDSIVVDTTVMLTRDKNAPQGHIRLSVQYAKGENSNKLNQAILHTGVALPDYIFTGNTTMDIPTATKFFAKRLVDEYIRDYQKLYLQDKNNPHSYQYNFFVNTKTRNGSKDILIYEVSVETYGGGPYGIQQTIVKNIDVKTGRVVELDSLFVPGYEKTLEELILSRISEKFDAQNMEELRKKHIFADGRVYVSDNFMIEKDQFTFIYCDSEIAPHEVGEIRIEIDKDEVKSILKENS